MSLKFISTLLSQDISGAVDVLQLKGVTVIGLLTLVLFVSWFLLYKTIKANEELQKETRGFIEKYYTLSTKVLGYLSKGTDV